eukprot:Selendium_serpulae@DN5358_c0_g1_i4.p3
MLLFGILAPLASYTVGVAYPTMMSFRALESKSSNDDKQWLTYWVVFAMVQFVEYFMSAISGAIPLYFILKMVFLLWLALPNTKGAEVLYNNYIQPFMATHQATIDKLCHFTSHFADPVASAQQGKNKDRQD